MKRRFRPTFGGLVLETKVNANNATTASSDASTNAQPTRRARFKPKVGLVVGKTNANQPSASTAVGTSPANKSVGQHPSTDGSPPSAGTKNTTVTTPAKNQPSHGTRSVASPGHNDAVSQPFTGSNKATVTTAAGGKPTSHQSVLSRKCSSPVTNNVGSQPSTTTSSKDLGSELLVGSNGALLVNDGDGSQSSTGGTNNSALPVNIDAGTLPSAGTNNNTMVESSDNPPSTGQQSTVTGIGGSPGNSPLSAGTNKDALTRNVSKQPLHDQQPSGNRRHSSALSKGADSESGTDKDKITTNVGDQSSFGGKTPTLPVNTIGNKDIGSEPSAGGRTDNSPAVNENAGNEPSKLELAKRTDDQISTGTNKGAITASTDRSSSNSQRASLQKEVIPNASVPDQPRRRARIRPKVGLTSAKAPAQKTVSSKKPTPSSLTISSDETVVSRASVSTGKEPQNVATPTSSATANTACQALTNPVGATKTSTTNATALPETSVQNKGATTSERRLPTRRSRITPKVGKVSEKISKSPVKNTTPVCQGAISVEVPSVDSSLTSESPSKQVSATSEDLNESALTNEKDPADVVNQPLPGISTVGEPNTEQTANTSEKSTNNGNPSLTSNNRASQNSNSSAPEKSKITSTSATTQPTRRARFKPRVGIIGSRSPAVPTQRTQIKPSAVSRPPLASTSSRDGAENDTDSRQNLTQCPGKFVSEENRSAQAKTATPSGNTENEQPQSRATVEGSHTNSTCNGTPTFGGENVTMAVSANINGSAQERIEHEAIVLSTNVSECNQSTDSSLAEQSTSLACVELNDERQKTVGAETILSNTKPSELTEVSNDTSSQNNVSPECAALHDSLQDVLILPQDNEQVCHKKDSASARTASCLPVMMEDCSILHPGNQAGDRLSQISPGLGDEDTPDHSAAVIIDSDFSKFHQLETADDLLRTLLGGNLHSGYVPPRTHVDTRTTTPDIESNPGESIHTPSSSTRLENETRISTQSDEPLDEVRTLPPSNQVDSTLSQSTQPAQNKPTTSTSRLVTKRQRGRPRNKQRCQPLEVSVLDISTIPIASNIEIEPEVCISEDIDHPILELPVDLIQENLPQNSPKESVSSGGLKQRFKHRRSGTVKMVLSRQRSENSDVEKINESVSTSGDGGSTIGDRSSTAVDRSCTSIVKSSTSSDNSGTSTDRRTSVDSGSVSMDRSSTLMDRSSISGDSSTSQNTRGQGVAEKSREIPRNARVRPNILVRRKSNKRNDPRKSTSESRIFGGKILEPESQDDRNSAAISVDPLSSGGQEATFSSAKDLPLSVQHCVVASERSSVTDESVIDLSNEFQVEVEVTNSASVIAASSEQDLSNDLQSEIVLSEDVSKRSCSVQDSENNTSENAENLVQSSGVMADTSVKDLPKDCEVEIVLDVTHAAQDNSNIVYECGGDVSTPGACVTENQSGDTVPSVVDELRTESALESSNHVQDNVDTVCHDVHSRLSDVNANLFEDRQVHELTQNSNEVVTRTDRTDRTDDDKTQTNIIDIQSSSSLQSFSLASPETTTEHSHTTLLAQEASKSLPGNKSTANSGPKSSRSNSSTPLLDISSHPSDISTVQSVCNDGQTQRISKFSTTDNSEAECILADPKSSTPLHEVSLNIPDSTIEQCLSNEQVTNEHSQSDTEDISTDKNTNDPISTSQTEDVSLDIPESAIEEAIRNTNEPLPDVIECPECPELVLCLKTVDDTSINEHGQNTSQTQPGTLEDSVARAMRRASGEFEEPAQGNDVRGERFTATSGNVANSETSTATNEKALDSEKSEETSKSKKRDKATIQRKRKARGKIVDDDDDELEDINVSNVGSGTQANDGNKETCDTSGNDDLGAQDGSLGDTGVQDGTTQDSRGSRGGSTPDEPNDATQDGSSKKPGSRKRQAKATKPKIPAKRGRKKTAVAQETENVERCDENEQGTTDAPEGESSLRNTSATLPGTEETPPISQKRKRGRPKGWKKSMTEKSKQPETAGIEETPSKKRKGQRTKATEKLDAVVNIANMKICDMITYNPMTNPMTSANDQERPSSFLSGMSSQNNQSEAILPANEDQPVENVGGGERTPVCAPRVTIDADGNIVLDEESLVIESTPVPDTLDKEVVFENANQQYKATQKRKNMDRWGKEETLYFYEVLSQIGTDFSLMAKLFPKRNRSELKRKFKREEKVNRDLIDKALSQRIPLAASLFADCLEETEEEMERSLMVQTAATETAAQA